MTKLEALKALAEKVEAGAFDAVPGGAKSPMFNAFMDVAECAFGMYGPVALPRLSWDTYKGCLNSAKALHEAVLPGWSWSKPAAPWKPKSVGVMSPTWQQPEEGYDEGGYPAFDGESDSPARAWLLAIIRALIAQEEAA